ncbi:NUDIX domain-containing protein [Phytohabitans kaempferiae]|uniref:NUDIX domain-containing protein n=1 Tax=Phytohabitans kaempferiae TaxID=1620943 RepID=A0ABV6M1S9_9ACTN
MSSPSGDYTATLPRKRMGSAVLLRDGDDRILLVEPVYKDYWELPGVAVDADESPYDAAVRELKGPSRPCWPPNATLHRRSATRPWAQNLTRDLLSADRRRALPGMREFADRIGVTA